MGLALLCKECGRLFFTQTALDNHINKYKDVCEYCPLIYDCPKCNFIVPYKSVLITHLYSLEHHQNFNICQKCRKVFKSKSAYNKHLNRKTPCVKDKEEIDLDIMVLYEHYKRTPIRMKAFVEKVEPNTTNRQISINIDIDYNKGGVGYLASIRKSFEMCHKYLGVNGLESAIDELDKIPHVFDKIVEEKQLLYKKKIDNQVLYEDIVSGNWNNYSSEEIHQIVTKHDEYLEQSYSVSSSIINDIMKKLNTSSPDMSKEVSDIIKNIFK